MTDFFKPIRKLKAKKPALYQFGMFYVMGGLAMVADLVTFAVCNYVVFTNYTNLPFRWWLIDYNVSNGGLCAFLAFAVSFAVSQVFNFFVQRKATFKANNNPVFSAFMYAVMVLLSYAFVLWLPTVFGAFFYRAFGKNAGPMVLKLLSEFLCALLQFPINKFVIMRKK